MAEERLGAGRFLRLARRDGWELVDRIGVTGIVVIVAVTPEGELLLVEQFREPVRARVVELPAGLVGDEPGGEDEGLLVAARRELREETGYDAERCEPLGAGPPSAGLTSEIVTFVRARRLVRVGDGGGVGDEAIELHRVPLPRVDDFLRDRQSAGRMIDPKVWAGLWLAALGPPRRPA